MKETKKGLITDFDNTLVKTRDFILRHLTHTCERLGIEIPPQEKLLNVLRKNPPFEEIFNSLFANEGSNVLAAYREDAMETAYEAMDSALKLVQTLNQEGAKIVIVSNRTNKLSERLAQAKFESSHILGIIQPASPKPSKDAYKEALDLLGKAGVARGDVYILGDSLDDYQSCPDDLEQRFYALTTGPVPETDFLASGIPKEHILSSPSELLAHMS